MRARVSLTLSLSLVLVAGLPAAALAGDLFVDQGFPGCATGTGGAVDPFCTIGAAVSAAVPGDTIHVAPGTYVENLTLGKNLTLIGTSGELVTIVDGSQSGSVVKVLGGTTVDIQGLTLTNGNGTPTGGALHTSQASTSLSNATLSASNGSFGGGIYAYAGALTLTNTTIDGNTASIAGGGIYSYGTALTLTNSTVTGNSATSGSGGGIYAAPYYDATVLVDTTVSGNDALNGSGGGLSFSSYYDPLSVTGSVFDGNTAADGGGVSITGSNGVASIATTTISGNTALTGPGGGLSFYAYYGTLNIATSTISGNSALLGNGGGLWNYNSNGPTTLANSTVSGNDALGGQGGGIYSSLYYGAVRAANCTVTANSAGSGGGVHHTGYAATFRSGGTIIAPNFATTNPDVEGRFVSAGYNIVGDLGSAIGFTNGLNGDQIGSISAPVFPALGVLADHGGLTLSHELYPTSPALDAGSATASPPFDQRGVTRPQGSGYDIGAFERGPIAVFTPIGIGVGGASVPVLSGGGAPSPGTVITLDTSNGLGAAPGVLVIGVELTSPVPLYGGTLYTFPQLTFPSTLGGPPGVPGAGGASFPTPIPDDMTLVGLSLAAQAGYLDLSAPQAVALTNALRITFG